MERKVEKMDQNRPQPRWVPFLALVLVVTIFLLGPELIVRLAYRHSMDFDMEMWKYAIQIKRKSENPKISHEHRPGAEAFLMGSAVKINSMGLRDQEYTLEKPASTYRILVLGDSMTFGWGAAVADTFSKKLERDLNQKSTGIRFEVINSGVGNYNTSQEVEYFRERGVRFHPDLVILCYFINDAEVTQVPNLGWLQERSYLYALLWSRARIIQERMKIRMNSEEYYRNLYQDSNPGWSEAKASLRKFPEIAQSISAKSLLVVIPELRKLQEGGHPFGFVYDQVSAVVKESGGETLQLLPSFQAAGIKDEHLLWVCPTDAHPSELAHRIMGDAILKHLLQKPSGVLFQILNASKSSL